MANPSISCPTVAGPVGDLTAAPPAKYAACPALPLRRYWEGPQALPREAGSARVGAAADGLSFLVDFQDSDIFSTATADQQKMWTLGDVAELFVKPGTARSDYWEIHVTPNDFLMDLHIPDRQRFTTGQVTWDEVIAPSSHTRKRVQVLEGRWVAEIVVPWAAFGLHGPPPPGTAWQFAVCRYNYNGGLANPEHSATAHLTAPGYHRYEEYSNLVF